MTPPPMMIAMTMSNTTRPALLVVVPSRVIGLSTGAMVATGALELEVDAWSSPMAACAVVLVLPPTTIEAAGCSGSG